jgi:hypothetical protein
MVCAGILANVMVCDCSLTVKLRVTVGAAAYVPSPG